MRTTQICTAVDIIRITRRKNSPIEAARSTQTSQAASETAVLELVVGVGTGGLVVVMVVEKTCKEVGGTWALH